MKRDHRIRQVLIVILVAALQISCNKLIEVDAPKTSLVGSAVFANDVTAISAMNGIYNGMIGGTNAISGESSITAISGLSADELKNYKLNDINLTLAYKNAMVSTDVPFWSELFQYIYAANSVMEGLEKSNSITALVKQQLTGEAKFIRAFCYFYLVNLFGDVPMILSTDYRLNKNARRTPKEQIYQQIITDLKDAINLLSPNYLGVDLISNVSERVRPNKWVAIALLARVFLYVEDFSNAEVQSSLLINNTAVFHLEENLNNVFLISSKEAIWQLQAIRPGYNTFDGSGFILTNIPGFAEPMAVDELLKKDFELGDFRKAEWIKDTSFNGITYSYAFKYKIKGGTSSTPLIEYLTVLRLAEQYLIRAEAKTQQNKLDEALSDLNVIRGRAGLSSISVNVNRKEDVLSLIDKERRVELFIEFGHRWLDLKRRGRINDVMSLVTPRKGGVWSPNWQLYPIPFSELEINPNLNPQNPGYN